MGPNRAKGPVVNELTDQLQHGLHDHLQPSRWHERNTEASINTALYQANLPTSEGKASPSFVLPVLVHS